MAILSACQGMDLYFFIYRLKIMLLRIPFDGNTIDKEVEILQVAMGIAPDTQGKIIVLLSRINSRNSI